MLKLPFKYCALIFVLSFLNVGITRGDNFTIGFVVNFSGVGKLIAGAILHAVEEINRNSDILNGHFLNFMTRTIFSHRTENSLIGAKAMNEMKENGVIAFIGPDGTCQAESFLATVWNLPLISYRCADFLSYSFGVHSTLIRTIPQISKLVASIIKYFKWTTINLIISHDLYWQQMGEAIRMTGESMKLFQVKNTLYFQFPYGPTNATNLYDFINKTNHFSGVYVVLAADDIALIDFIDIIQKSRKVNLNEIVILIVSDEPYNEDESYEYFFEMAENEETLNERQLQVFQSILKLVRAPIKNKDYSKFLSHVISSNTKEPFFIPTHPLVDVHVPIYAAYAYDAVYVLAQALNETLQNGEDPKNGTAIIEKIRSRNFSSILGQEFSFDSLGDTEDGYILVASKSTKKQLDDIKMEIVASFSRQSNELFQLPILRPEPHSQIILNKFLKRKSYLESESCKSCKHCFHDN